MPDQHPASNSEPPLSQPHSPEAHSDPTGALGGAEGVEAIRARVEAATPGPWTNDAGRVIAPDAEPQILNPSRKRSLGIIRALPDAEFIAHARTDIPLLLAEIGRLREALDASEGERDDLDTGAGMLLGENVELQADLDEARTMLAAMRAAPFRCQTHMCGSCGGCKAAKVRDLLTDVAAERDSLAAVVASVRELAERWAASDRCGDTCRAPMIAAEMTRALLPTPTTTETGDES